MVFTPLPIFYWRGIVVSSVFIPVCPSILHIFRSDQSYNGTCQLSGYFDLLTFKMLFRPLLGQFKWQLLHIFRADHPAIGPVYCRIILTVWPLALALWLLPCTFCMAPCSKTINDNCFIFPGHINLTWNLCTVESVRLFDLCPWNYNLSLWNLVCKLLLA